MYLYVCSSESEFVCVAVPVSGCILNAGTVESLCMKPYVTLPLEPSSASTAWTCRTNVPAGWFSRTDVLSLYCWHWGEWDSRWGRRTGGWRRRRRLWKGKRNFIEFSVLSKLEAWACGRRMLLFWKDRVKIMYWWDQKRNTDKYKNSMWLPGSLYPPVKGPLLCKIHVRMVFYQ